MQQLILASQSPRRKTLLQQIGIEPICMPVDIDESLAVNELPLDYCQRMAATKAQTAWDISDKTIAVLGSDTIVVYSHATLGKPKDVDDAIVMLKKLSDNTHQVLTAVAVIRDGQLVSTHSISDVKFAKIAEHEIIAYVNSQEPMDKAGSYAIQGYAARWIKSISGSYSGIMGLPLYETAKLLK